MQGFPTISSSEEFLTQADNLRKPPSYSLKSLRKLSSHQKTYPPGDQSKKRAYTWCQLESFSLINFSWLFNPFLTNLPLLYLLETSENRRFSDVFRGYGSETLVENGLMLASIV